MDREKNAFQIVISDNKQQKATITAYLSIKILSLGQEIWVVSVNGLNLLC